MDNFKTAEELGVAAWEHDGLVTVLGMLESGVITDVSDRTTKEANEAINKDGIKGGGSPKFDMSNTVAAYDCGTAMCIGGWVYILGHSAYEAGKVCAVSPKMVKDIWQYVNVLPPGGELMKLYWDELSLNALEAAKKLRGYLETGVAERV